jgi:hypothetical protein
MPDDLSVTDLLDSAEQRLVNSEKVSDALVDDEEDTRRTLTLLLSSIACSVLAIAKELQEEHQYQDTLRQRRARNP